MKLTDDKFIRHTAIVSRPTSKISRSKISGLLNPKVAYSELFDKLAQLSRNVGQMIGKDVSFTYDGQAMSGLASYVTADGILGIVSNGREYMVPASDVALTTGTVSNKSAQADIDEELLMSPLPSNPREDVVKPSVEPATTPTAPNLSSDLPQELKDNTIVSFLNYVSELHKKYVAIHGRLLRYQNPRYVNTPNGPRAHPDDVAPAAEKQNLMRILTGLQHRISKAGSMWRVLHKAYGPEYLNNEHVKWLTESVASGAYYPAPLTPEDIDPLPPPKTAPTQEESDAKTRQLERQQKKYDESSLGKYYKNYFLQQQHQLDVINKERADLGLPPITTLGPGAVDPMSVTAPTTTPKERAIQHDIRKNTDAINVERAKLGLPPVKKSSQVDAPMSADDMISYKNYFDTMLAELVSLDADEHQASAGTSESPIDGQRDTLSSEEIPGTGKIGQATQPSVPPQLDNLGIVDTPSDMDFDMGDGANADVEHTTTMLETINTINDALSDLEDQIIDSNIESPASVGDTGYVPSPPDKIAADAPAKDYWKGYFGDYGKLLSDDKDRFANIIDTIDAMSDLQKVPITAHDISNLSDAALSRPRCTAEVHSTITSILDRVFIAGNLTSAQSPVHIYDAIQASPMRDKLIHLITAAGMDAPKVKKHNTDAINVSIKDVWGDASHDTLMHHPAHLPMKVDKSYKSGVYTSLEISWDPRHGAACRSDAGMKQMLISFVKGLESNKEFKDLGFLGQISIDDIDIAGGYAKVYFLTSKGSDAPTVVIEKE